MKIQIWTPSDWSIRKWQGSHFFKFPKNRFFQFLLYLAIFSLIVWWFEVQNVSNDRECFSLQNGLFLIFFESHLLWEKKVKFEKMRMQFRSSNLSVAHECIVKVRDPSLNFIYVVALLTVHLLVYFPLKNFIRSL
jgi:hypothetical protein